MKKSFTSRGFVIYIFEDTKGVKCSIQKSSSAMEDKIWLGADEIGLKHFKPGLGWEDVELLETEHEFYIANTRIHINQSQAKDLIKILKQFVKTGEI